MAILSFSILSPRVFSSDDSNPSGLTPTLNTATSNATTNQTIDAINQLLQENNATQNYNNATTQGYNNATQDPRYQQFLQLLNQYETEAHAGQNIQAAQTLAQLQQYIQTPEMQQYLSTPQGKQLISPALQSLVLRITDTSACFTVDPTILQQHLGAFNGEGMPTGWQGESPFQTASDLRILGDLMTNIDPKTGLSLLQDSNLLNGEIGSGLFRKITTGIRGPGVLRRHCGDDSRI